MAPLLLYPSSGDAWFEAGSQDDDLARRALSEEETSSVVSVARGLLSMEVDVVPAAHSVR